MQRNLAVQEPTLQTHMDLQDENHYTTPYDIYLMLKEALNYPEFTQITQMGSYTVEYTHADGSSASTTLDCHRPLSDR